VLAASSGLAASQFSPAASQFRGRRPKPKAGWQSSRSRADAIVDVALELFRQRGFAGTGVDDIAAALGFAGSTIYRTYPSKSDILLDAL